MRLSLACVITLLLSVAATARTINVPADYATIQAGIDASVNGDTVLVAPGEYSENITIAHNILLTSSQGPDSSSIRGYVRLNTGLDTTCNVRGFTIFNISGSAIYTSNSSPAIEANIIKGSSAISMNTSYAIIRGNIIKDIFGWDLPGIRSYYGWPVIENNIIMNNSAAFGDAGIMGVGIYLHSGTIRRNVIAGNRGSSYYGMAVGGGIYRDAGTGCKIYNNTITANGVWSVNGSSGCAGIFMHLGPSDTLAIFKNNIIAFNENGGGICVTNESAIQVDWDYNLVFGNEEGDYGSQQPGPHDLQADPMFIDTALEDYYLLSNSPCIDAGDPSFPLDPDSTRSDIGAYYFDQAVGIDDPGPTEPYLFTLKQNYPNPFNAQTTISYCLDQDATVSLLIYSITGQLVQALALKEIRSSGEHRYVWNGTDKTGKPISTGIYFYELHIDNHRESKAMIMLK